MKKILLFLFVLNCKYCFPQAFPLKIKIYDSIHSDSVLFGLHYESTIGVDAFLGEFNIIDEPIDSFEIRVIQRDEDNYNCLTQTWDVDPIYAPENLDLKIDYRPPGDQFYLLNNNFEIFIKSDFYPYTISGAFSNIGGYDMGSQILLLDSTCNIITATYPNAFEPNQIIYTINNADKYFLIVHLEHEVGIEYSSEIQNIKIYPIPVIDYLKIGGFLNITEKITITDISGRTLLTYFINKQDNVTLDLKELKSGLFIVNLFDKNNKTIKSKLIIKQ